MRVLLILILTLHTYGAVLGDWSDFFQSVKINLYQDDVHKTSSAQVVRQKTSHRLSSEDTSEIESSEPEYRLSYKDYETTWQLYKLTYNKSYESQSEELQRFSIFLENVKSIEEHNQRFHLGLSTYWMDINQFSDWTDAEIEAMMPTVEDFDNISKQCPRHRDINITAPASLDWRKHGYVTGVKKQGHCGSCWAFSAIGAVEGQWAKKRGQLISLSEQQLVDCSVNNNGCNGGKPFKAIQYIAAKGVEGEVDYPYLAQKGVCKFNVKKVKATVKGCRQVTPNESALKQAVASVGPISVAFDVSEKFRHYSGGIFVDDACVKIGRHAVVVVGYGSDKQDYWIVKNSWGTTWGERGYFRMVRNRRNICGIANNAVYPVI